MENQEKRRLWSVAALTLGLVSAPASSHVIAAQEGRAIDRLPEIRAALRGALDEGREPAKLSRLGKLLAQWGNWPNWSNWSNG